MADNLELRYDVRYDMKANFYWNLCGEIYTSYSVCYVDIAKPLLAVVHTVPESVEICRFFGICQKRWEDGVDLETVKRGLERLRETRMPEIDLLYSISDERGVERFAEVFERVLKFEAQVAEYEEVFATSRDRTNVTEGRRDELKKQELRTIELMRKLITIKVNELDQIPGAGRRTTIIQNALLRGGIRNFLVVLCDGPELKIRNFGKKSQEELERIMEHYGVSWSDKERLDMKKIPIELLPDAASGRWALYSWGYGGVEPLWEAGIRLTGDLVKYTADELQDMMNFTENGISFVSKMLGEIGLSLKE